MITIFCYKYLFLFTIIVIGVTVLLLLLFIDTAMLPPLRRCGCGTWSPLSASRSSRTILPAEKEAMV